MKKVYIILSLLITAIADNYAQGAMNREAELNTGIKIYQDSDKKMLHVTYNANERSDLSIKIKDSSGKVLYTEKEEEPRFDHAKSLDLARFYKGIYYIEVDSRNAQEVERIEVN